jgi:hypothetical protein
VWRIAVIDSGIAVGESAPSAAARFVPSGDGIRRVATLPDPTGHGTRIARIVRSAAVPLELLVAQVFDSGRPTCAAAVAAAVEWACARRAQLVHMSLGLAVDRVTLRDAVARARFANVLVVAATPARGAATFPAAYPGVLRGTGDARCGPDEISRLAADTFGGCVRAGDGAGASVGAAHVTRALLEACTPGMSFDEARTALAARSRFAAPEDRRSETVQHGPCRVEGTAPPDGR